MTIRAWIFIYNIFSIGTLITIVAAVSFDKTEANWGAFAVLVVFATVAQLHEVEGTFRNTYYPNTVFFLAAANLLDPLLFILVVTIPHLIEWIVKRSRNHNNLRAWYIQPFNIATHIIASYTIFLIYTVSQGANNNLTGTPFRVIIIGVMVLSYVLINHFLVGMALYLARGLSFNQSGLMSRESIVPEIVMGCPGYVIVVLWKTDPWLILPILSTVVLVSQVLKIPQLKQDAQTDVKTGLLNAKYFNKLLTAELEQAQRYKRQLSLILADLDYMRNINNTYGHLAGDAVLAGVAKIIRQCIPDENTAGRFGGEEFMIVLPGVGGEDARKIAERLRITIETTRFESNTQPEPIKATMSIGVATFPHDGTSTTNLIHAADVAVYHAKHTGRNRVVLITEVPQGVNAGERVSSNAGRTHTSFVTSQGIKPVLEKEVLTAFEQGQFELHYQPIIVLATGRISGIEALLRWKHPERGYISPAEFIPLAEKSGLIYRLGLWVIAEIIRTSSVWNTFPFSTSQDRPPLVMNVNLSPIQLRHSGLVEEIARLLEEAGIDPAWLQLEITENVLLDYTPQTLDTLQRLKGLGVKLAVDDFGTGYSNLNYLKHFQFDTLKIDQSFITDLRIDKKSRTIIQAMIHLGQALNLKVVAEGVEQEEQVLYLKQLGCDLAQGYYFARPLPAEKLATLLRTGSFEMFDQDSLIA